MATKQKVSSELRALRKKCAALAKETEDARLALADANEAFCAHAQMVRACRASYDRAALVAMVAARKEDCAVIESLLRASGEVSLAWRTIARKADSTTGEG